jgi:hypothetical protein
MNRTEALTEVLNDVTRPERERAIARAALDAVRVSASSVPVSELLQELLLASDKPLHMVPYFEVHSFCSAHGWQSQSVLELFERWRDVYCETQAGRGDVERIASCIRNHDFEDWGHALELWKDSGWKASNRLIDVLERIAGNRGGVHTGEVVGQARQYLDELKRRTAP